MALKDYREPTATIPLGQTTLTVRGISLTDFAILRERHGARCMQVLLAYQGEFASGDSNRVEQAIIGVACELADLLIDMIALAAREPNGADAVSRMPLAAQIAALTEIIRLTADGGLFTTPTGAFQDALAFAGPALSELVQ